MKLSDTNVSSFSATAASEAKGTSSFCGQNRGKGSLEFMK